MFCIKNSTKTRRGRTWRELVTQNYSITDNMRLMCKPNCRWCHCRCCTKTEHSILIRKLHLWDHWCHRHRYCHHTPHHRDWPSFGSQTNATGTVYNIVMVLQMHLFRLFLGFHNSPWGNEFVWSDLSYTYYHCNCETYAFELHYCRCIKFPIRPARMLIHHMNQTAMSFCYTGIYRISMLTDIRGFQMSCGCNSFCNLLRILRNILYRQYQNIHLWYQWPQNHPTQMQTNLYLAIRCDWKYHYIPQIYTTQIRRHHHRHRQYYLHTEHSNWRLPNCRILCSYGYICRQKN